MKEFLQKHRKRIVTGAVVLCVLGGGTYYYMDSLNANQAQTLYTTGKVEKGDVKTSISATGTINPVNYVDVSTNVAGKLEKVLVKEMIMLQRDKLSLILIHVNYKHLLMMLVQR